MTALVMFYFLHYKRIFIDDEMYEGIVSMPDSKIKMYIIPTNEELEIAEETMEIVNK